MATTKDFKPSEVEAPQHGFKSLNSYGVKEDHYSSFCFCKMCKNKRKVYKKQQAEQNPSAFILQKNKSKSLKFKNLTFESTASKILIKPREVVLQEDQDARAVYEDYVAEWPRKYLKRFEAWYVRRSQKKNPDMVIRDFDEWFPVLKLDVFHHVKNWDQGLKKALLKDTLIEQTRKVVRRVKYQEKRQNQRSAQHGQHPHEQEQITDKDLNTLSYKFAKEAVIDPKKCNIVYLESGEFVEGNEQGDSGTTASDLEQTTQMTSTANITFVDERPVDSTQLHTKGSSTAPDLSKDIAESSWTLNSVLTREYPIESFEWKVGQTFTTEIYSNGVPKLITDADYSMITRQLQFFAFLRAGVKIRVQLNGTKFHCGRLICYFKPITWSNDTDDNFYGITAYPYFFLDASVSNSGEITIPYTHLLTYFSQEKATTSQSSINTLGKFVIRPYNDLRAADQSSQSLFGQIYASLDSPVVHLPTKEISVFSYSDGVMQGLEGFLKKTAGGLINSGLGLADKFTGGLVTGAGDALCNLLGICDKPLDPVSSSPIINRTAAPLAHGAGLDRSIRLALSPISQTDTDPSILGAVDSDFNLLTLAKIPTLLNQIEWKSSDAANTKLYDMLVTPVYLDNPQYTYNGTARFTNYTPTMLAYISRAFCLWRGTLKIKIQVVATQFHSGRLALIYDPHGTGDFDLTDYQSNKSHNIIMMDVQEQQELVVELPYFAIKPWTRCDKFRSDANLNDKSGIKNHSFIDTDVTGVFRIFIVNSLVRPSNVPDSVQINVFFYAGDNFELSVPNPVTPLSVRKGPETVQYANDPRYPWVKTGTDATCNLETLILDLFNTGQQLLDRKEISVGDNWYNTTILVNTYEAVRYKNSTDKLQYYRDNTGVRCKNFIDSLKFNTTVTIIDPIMMMEEQGVESYTTTRENEGQAVLITDQNQQSQVAPRTISEDAMNLQTLLRRFWPLYASPTIKNSNRFTLITIPVSPSFVPDADSQTVISPLNRRYDVHNLAWFARLYTYWRGSMRYKIFVNADDSDIFVWHNPVDTKNFNVISGFDYDHVNDQMSFASDISVTRVQQCVEVEVPFYSAFNQLVQSHQSNIGDLRAINGVLYVAIRSRNHPINFSLMISTGDDFFLNVLRAPPIVHEPASTAYSDADVGTDELVRYPELQKSLMHDSSTVQIPGTFVFNRFSTGVYEAKPIPEAPPLNFNLPQLTQESHQIEGEEQMFSVPSNFAKCVETAEKLTEAYDNDVKPVLDKALPTLEQLSKLTEEIQEHTLPQVLGHAKLFHKDVVDTHETIKQFLPKLEETFSHVQAASIGVQNATSSVSGLCEVVEDTAHYATWLFRTLCISSVWLNLIEMYKRFTWTALLNVVVSSCTLFKVPVHKIVKFIYEHATKLFEEFRTKVTNGAMVEQSFEEFVESNSAEISLGLAAVATIVYCAMFGSLPSFTYIKQVIKETVQGKEQAGGISDFLKSVHFSNLGCKAVLNAFDFFKDWMDKLVAWFLGNDCPEVLLRKQFDEKATLIEQWLTSIQNLEDEDFYHLALTDIDCHNRFYKLADEGLEFTKWTIREKVPPNVSMIIRDGNRKLNEMIKRINEIRPGHGYRYAPFVVCFHGETSTGKSEMMHYITADIREALNIPHYNSVYAVPPSDKYLSGYEGQTIIEWDDMMQNTNQDDLVSEFVNWCSNADTKVNMADLAHKGSHFVSKAILCTTNCGYVNVNCIRDMDAFRRRRNVMIGVQFAAGHDKDTMINAPHDPTFSHAVFSILDNSRERVLRAGMTWAEVKDYIMEQHQAWDVKQREKVDQYFQTTPSLRIPPGVIIEEEIEDATFEDASEEMVEEGTNVRYSCKVLADSLTEEEQIDAELFQITFEESSFSDQLTYYDRFKMLKRKVLKKSSKLFDLLKRKLKLVGKSIYDAAVKFYEEHPNFVYALGAISSFVAVGGMISFIQRMFSPQQEEGQYEQNSKVKTKIIKCESSYDTTVKAKTKVTKAEGYNSNVKHSTKITKSENGYSQNVKNPTRITHAEGEERGTCDEQAVLLARNKVHPLLCYLGWETNPLSLQGLCIGGKVLLVPHHFFRRAKAGDFFWYLRGADKILIEFSPERMFQIRDKDAVLYYVGAQFDSRKCILNCFIEERYLSMISKSVPALLVGTTANGVILEKAGTSKGQTWMTYAGKDAGAPVYKQYGWEYPFHTLNGECGSILIATTNKLPPPSKIIGMHVAGYTSKVGGFSILLTREMIVETLSKLTDKFGQQVYGASLPPQVIQDEQAFHDQVKVVPDGAFSFYGVMDSKFCPSQPTKSNLQPTPFQGELYPVTKIPAMLKPDKEQKIYPLDKALKKYGQLTRPFKIQDIKAVSASILNDLLQLDSEIDAAPTTNEVAAFGLPAVPYVDKMNMRSSPGWPYQCLPKARGEVGKGYLFDSEKGIISDDLLLSNIVRREELAKQGQRYPSIWRDCMKDELRPVEKVKEGKTRLFTIAPVDFTIVCRKYFLPFVQAFYANYSQFFSAVGINPESYDWTVAYNRLRSYGNLCVAGDFSSYDGTLMSDLMWEVGIIINKWFDAKGTPSVEDNLVRLTLIDEMIHTYQLIQNCVYKTHQGNPSGNPLTVIINTIVNCFYMRLVWMEIMRKSNPSLCTMDAYENNVKEEMYGDDNRLVIKEQVIEIFNQVTITQQFAEHGIIYTDELKSSTLKPYKLLQETSFLKRSYRSDSEIGSTYQLPVMQLDTITSLTNWRRDNLDEEDQLLANMRSALGFAFFHGREFYEDFYKKFAEKLREHNIKPLNLTYDELLDIFLADLHGEKRCYATFTGLDF